MTESKFLVLLADDHVLVTEGIARLVQDKFELAGLAKDGRELLELAESTRPDVVVMDISMPELNGLDACRRLHKMLPDVKVIFLTMHSDVAYVREAFGAGAKGYLLKREASSELIRAIELVLVGETYLSPGLEGTYVVGKPVQPNLLTDRQREVLQLVAEGQSAKQIAFVLSISIKTVEFHKASIMKRLGVRTIAQLTRYALEHGISGSAPLV